MNYTHSPAELQANPDQSSSGLTLAELVLENAPFGAVVLDTSLQVLSINRTLRGWFGHVPSGPLQKLDVIDIIRVRYPSERARVLELLNAVKSGTSPAPLTMTVSVGEGSQIDVSVTASALRESNGAVHAYAVYLHVLDRDLQASQDRHQAEELRRATHRFDHMAEAHHDSCIYFLSPDGKICEWSSSAKRLHGFKSEQVSGMPMECLHVSDDGVESVSIQDALRLATERGQWDMQGWCKRHNGQRFWGTTQLTLLRAEDGTIEGLSCITRDMTASKDLDKVMNDLSGELEKRVSERLRQYLVPNKDLDVFTQHIAHDLRAPLRHLTIFADLLLDSVPQDLHPDQIRYRDGMRNALKRLGIMVEALLTYARLGRIDLHPSPMASAPVVKDVVARVQEKYPGVKATFHVQDDLPVVISDPGMLTEVLTQVVDNAVKFSQRADKPEIHIGWSPEAGSTGLFFVADNGVGFNVEMAANLFVMFSRQHHSLEFTGDGIGLALAKRIIERHNGRMWADSVPGHGCTLYFSLPVEHRITPSQLSALGI